MSAASCLFADKTINEDWVLPEDTTVSGTLTVDAGKTVWLNGHTLTANKIAGSGTISGSILPEEYIQLEYIESTDAGKQYIDTGVKGRSAVKVEADIVCVELAKGSYRPFLAASLDNSNTVNAKVYGLWIWKDKWAIHYAGDNWYNTTPAVSYETRMSLTAAWSSKARSLSINNGTPATAGGAGEAAVDCTMYLPAWNRNNASVGGLGLFKIYSVKLYNPQDTLVRNFVPAKRVSDGKTGLYDLVNGVFHENKSETEFDTGYEVAYGGELCLNVTDSFVNSTVSLAGSLKLVKDGPKTFTSKKSQTYTGGTLIRESALKVDQTISSRGLGAAGSRVEVAASAENGTICGGQIYYNNDTAQRALTEYDVTIAGYGSLDNYLPPSDLSKDNAAIFAAGAKSNGWRTPFLRSLTLSGDAKISVNGGDDGFSLRKVDNSLLDSSENLEANRLPLNLQGHTLYIGGTKRICIFAIDIPDEGRIFCFQGGTKHFQGKYNKMPKATLEVAQGATITGDSGISGLVCSNLVFAGSADAKIPVTAIYRYEQKPSTAAGKMPTVVLGDGVNNATTLDVSGYTTANPFSADKLTCAANSTVTVELGGMEFDTGDRVVAWSDGKAPDSSVQFVPAGTDWTAEGRKIKLVARTSGDAQGLYVASTETPAFAEWNLKKGENGGWDFFTADGTAYPGEWTDGVTDSMQVRFDSEAEYNAIRAAGVSPAAYVMTGLTLEEGAGEVDLTGLPFSFADSLASIDLKGRTLVLPGSVANSQIQRSVVSSVEGGALAIYVADGATAENNSLLLHGGVKLVKRGAGTLVAAVSQDYTGGTDVEAGVVRPPDPQADSRHTYAGDTFHPFGSGLVNVKTGAVFDVRDNYGYTNICLQGGRIANTLRSMLNPGDPAKPGIHVASLAGPEVSYLDTTWGTGSSQFDAIYGGNGAPATDLGGRTLVARVAGNKGKGFYVRTAFTNGTLQIDYAGQWVFFDAAGMDMSTANLIHNSALLLQCDVDLGGYEQTSDTIYIRSRSGDANNGRFSIYGSFTANAPRFADCVMMDGSKLDFSKKTETFALQCPVEGSVKNSVDFDSGAKTIYVETGSREIVAGDLLATWGKDGKPGFSTVFKLVSGGEPVEGLAVKADADGLRVVSTAVPAYAEWDVENNCWKFLTVDMRDYPGEWTGGVTADITVLFSSYAQYAAMDKTVPAAAFLLTSDFTVDEGIEELDMTGSLSGVAADGATIDANGAKLKLPAALVCGDTAFTVTSSAQGGVFEIEVGENDVKTNSSVAIAGGANLQVWKTGEGKLVFDKINQSFGANGATSLVVKVGRAAKTNGKRQCGAQYSKIKVEDGAQFDFYGRGDWDYDYSIAGEGPDGSGALVNTDTSTPSAEAAHYGQFGYMRDIVLDADATIGGTGEFGLIFYNYGNRSTTLNGHTLTLKMPSGKIIYAGWMSYVGTGTVRVMQGTTLATYSAQPTAGNATLEIDGSLYQDGYSITPVKALKFGATGRFGTGKAATGNRTFNVLETYKPNAESTSSSTMKHPNVVLGNEQHLETVLDLSNFTTAFNALNLTFAEGSTVTIDMSDAPSENLKALAKLPKLVDWSGNAPAQNVEFRLDAATKVRYSLEKLDDGLKLYAKPGLRIVIR